MTDIVISAKRTWITDPLSPVSAGGPSVVCGSRQTTGINAQLDGNFRTYAGNRRKAVPLEEDTWAVALTLVQLTRSDVRQLVAWRGQTLLLRTYEGEVLYVAYFSNDWLRMLNTEPRETDDWNDVSYMTTITFQVVSWTPVA